MKYTFNFNIDIITFERLIGCVSFSKGEALKIIKERAMIELLNRATIQLLETQPNAKWQIQFIEKPYTQNEYEEAKYKLLPSYSWKHQNKSSREIEELVDKRLEEIKPFNITLEIEEVEKDE